MPQIVDVKGVGHVSFPDEMSADQIKAALLKQWPAQELTLDPYQKAALQAGTPSPEQESFASYAARLPAKATEPSLTQYNPSLWEKLRYSPAGMEIFGRPPAEQEMQRTIGGGGEPSPATVVGSAIPFTLGEGAPAEAGRIIVTGKALTDLGVAAKMAWDTIRGLPDQYDAFKRAIREHNRPEAMRQGLSLGMSAAFILAGLHGANKTPPDNLPPDSGPGIINEARNIEQATPRYGGELKLPEGATPGLHIVPKEAPVTFHSQDIINLAAHKVGNVNAVRRVLKMPGLSDADAQAALDAANAYRARTKGEPNASTIRENQRIGVTAGQEPQGGEINRGGNVQQAASRTQPGGVAPETRGVGPHARGAPGEVPLSEPVRSFGVDLQTGLRMSTEKAQQTGLEAKSISDLNALAEMRRRAVANQRALTEQARKLSESGDKDGALKLLTQASQLQAQLPREAIETALNAGSHNEAELQKKLGPRPLDWREHPEAADWLKKNADSLGIALPDELKGAAEPAKPESPKPEPERPPGAREPTGKPAFLAVVVKDPKTGQWVEGPNHPTVEEALGMPETTKQERNTPHYGFKVRTPAGGEKILNREGATRFAKQHGLLIKEPEAGQAHSDEVKGETGKPLSEEGAPVKPAETTQTPQPEAVEGTLKGKGGEQWSKRGGKWFYRPNALSTEVEVTDPNVVRGLEQELAANQPGQQEIFQPPSPKGSQRGGGAAMPEEFPTAPGLGQNVLGSVAKALQTFRRTLTAAAKRGRILDVILSSRDRGDNLANIFARQYAGEIRRMVERVFPVKLRSVGEDALSLVIESQGNPQELSVMREKVINSDKASAYWRKRFFDAADFALYNWDKLKPIAQRYKQITDAEQFAEEGAGLPVLRLPGYVMHVQELPESESGLLVPQSDGTMGTPFTRVRTHPTFADSIAAGVDPKTLNAVDLLQTRLRRGQQIINSRAWVDGLKDLTGQDGQPIAREPLVQKRADGSSYPIAPQGYSLTYAGFQPIAIREGYTGVFGALTSPSWFRQHEPTRWLTTANAVGKSINLVFDTFHLGRIAYWQSLIRATNLEAPLPSYKRGLTLLDTSVPELRRMARENQIPQSWLPDLLESKRRLRLAVDSGYNIGRISDALYEDVLHNLPFIGRFNKWLFEQYQRGAMSETWLSEFRRIRKALPDLSEEEAARRVSRDLNVRFGNVGRQGWFRSRTAQDAARLVALAPQWNEGLIKSELGAITQTADYLRNAVTGKKLYAGVLMRSVGTMALMTFVANQVINQITRGKFTWENPEEGLGAKLSAWIPDVVGNGPGFFLHPLGLAAETTHLLMQAYERTGNWYDTLSRYLRSRSSAAMRPVLTFLTQKNFLGRTIAPGNVWGEIVKSAIPVPISGSALYAAGRQIITGQPSEQFAGQYQKQALASMGIKTEQAPSAEQRMRNLAAKYNREHNITPGGEFYTGDYIPLTRAIALGNQQDAATALQSLFGKKSVPELVRYYEHWWRYPFTGQQGRERQFYQTLNPEEKGAYQKARQQRLDISKKALKMIGDYVRTHQPRPVAAQ